MPPPYNVPTCRGALALGSGCGRCSRCVAERELFDRFPSKPKLTRAERVASMEAAQVRRQSRERIATAAPITYEMACKIYGGEPPLGDDAARAVFFGVWALAACEWADALIAELDKEK